MEKIIPWSLIVAHLKHESTSEEDALFQNWMEESDNARLFSEIEALWEEIRNEVSKAQPDIAASWEKMEMRLKQRRSGRKTLRHIFYKITAAAAVILLIIGLSYGYRNYQAQYKFQTYSTLYGKSKILLPDSSVVWLNAGTTIRYASAFLRDRHLELDGEASFEVTKDKKHPFIVATDGMKVKVYGTRFNVNAYDKSENIKVALNRGSVSVLLDNGNESFLQPGEIAMLNKKSRQLKIEKTDIGLETCWASETVSFKNKPLGVICQYLEKWYDIRIEVDPDIATAQYYTFTVKDDSIEAILRLMSKINPISYSFEENNHVKIMKVAP